MAYLAAEEAKNAQTLSHCFAEDGTVHDEGKDYKGRAAIQRWKEAADAKYRYVLQPISAQNPRREDNGPGATLRPLSGKPSRFEPHLHDFT
jgi:hypothetical protein